MATNTFLLANIIFQLLPVHSTHIQQHTLPIQHYCNSTSPCHDTIFRQINSDPIHIHCNDHHSCNNVSILTSSSDSLSLCHIHCYHPMSCINIDTLLPICQCHGHCIQTSYNNRRLLTNDDDYYVLSDLPDYVYISIIGALVLICGILLLIMYCKWRHERILNRHISAGAHHNEYMDEETRSLSGKNDAQLIATDADINFNHLNTKYHQKQNIGTGTAKYDTMMLYPEKSFPQSDDERAKSPFTATTMRTPSPQPYNPQSPYIKRQESAASKSDIISVNDASHPSQFSSQQSSQPHAAAFHVMMQPIPSPNTTPQSHTIEISGGHKQIIHMKKRRGYNQDSLSMSSISIPYNNRKESITGSNKYNINNPIKEEQEVHITKQHIEINMIMSDDPLHEEMVMHQRNKKDNFVLSIPDVHSHEKSHSNMSLSSIPLDRISVMAPQQSVQYEDEASDHELEPHEYEYNIVQEHQPHIVSNQHILEHEITQNVRSSESEEHMNMDMDQNQQFKKLQKQNKIPNNDIIDKEELTKIFKLNEEDENDDENHEVVSDHEDQFEKERVVKEDKNKKKKKKKRKGKKKKKKHRHKKKKKKSRNAIVNEEIEYEPDFIADLEGTAANHHPPQHVMGFSQHELEKQVARDKVDENKKSFDVQSTVSSHPAFDAKNLKHFMEFVDEEPVDNVDVIEHEAHKKTPHKMTDDGTFTEREYKEDDSESMSSGTSNSMDEYSYSTSNEDEYIRSDVLSLASADPYPLHKRSNHGLHNIRLIAKIKEDKILETNDDDETPNGDITPSGDQTTQHKMKYDKKRNIFQESMLNNTEYLKYIHNDTFETKSDNLKRNYLSEIYGTIISFMGRHDRWLHCRLVCKQWNHLVYTDYWIFTEHMTIAEAHDLKPGDKFDHRDDAGRFIKSTVLNRKGTVLNVHYDGWSSKWDSWCDYSVNLHKFAVARSISRCPRVRGKHIEEKMFVDIKPSYRHGKHCNWRKGKVRRLDEYSGQIEVIYKYKQKKYLLWVHLDNKNEVDRLGKHTQFIQNNNSVKYNRCSNYSLATTVHEE